MTDTLSLPEQFLLLCLNDETGQPEAGRLSAGMAGAILAELMLQGRVGLHEDHRRLTVLDDQPVDDPVLNEALKRLPEEEQPFHAAHVLGRLNKGYFLDSWRELQIKVADRLVERGILDYKEGRTLWVMTDRSYPTQDAAPETELRQQLRSALLDEEPNEAHPLSPRLGVLISLLHGSSALNRVLSAEELVGAEPRVRRIREGAGTIYGGAPAVQDAFKQEDFEKKHAGVLFVGEVIATIGQFFV